MELTHQEVTNQIKLLEATSEATVIKLKNFFVSKSSMEIFQEMKFGKVGCDPLDSNRPLNLIEQLNQSFTYLASFKATDYLFTSNEHKKQLKGKKLKLNLGTIGGSDIESLDGEIVAEVFATTNISNNDKLRKDISKVQEVSGAQYRYVFFLTNNNQHGVEIYETKVKHKGVTIVRLSSSLEKD